MDSHGTASFFDGRSSEISLVESQPQKEDNDDPMNSDKQTMISSETHLPTDCADNNTSIEAGVKTYESPSLVLGDSPTHPSKLQGAWTKPLSIAGDTSHGPPMALESSGKVHSEWPALSSRVNGKTRGDVAQTKIIKTPLQVSTRVEVAQTQRIKIPTDKTRFPWAARMNPQSRNLHRVTVPEYMEDGTPKVTIPDHVLLHGLQNQKEYVIGQFTRCLVPSGGLVYAVLNRLWGRKCEIFVKKLGEFSYIFHIPDEATRKWILSRGLWHVDDCILFVAPWTPSNSLTLPEITSIPVWVTLKNIPSNLYSIFGIEWIASGLGEPMLSHKPWLDPTMLGEAKVMVEVELDKPFPQKIAAWDKQGNFSLVDVEYSWLPTTCERCGLLGHKSKRCLSISGHKSTTSVSGKKVSSVAHVFASSSDGSALNMNIQKDTEVSAAENTAAKMGATLPSDTHAQSSPQQKSTTQNPTKPTTSQDTQRDGNQQTPVLPAHTLTTQSPIVFGSCIEELNVSRVVDSATPTIVEELLSLTTISELENMYKSPIIVCINEETESPPLDSAPPLQNMDSTPKETSSMALKDCSSSDPLHLVSNQFASLVFLEGEEDGQLDMDDCTDSIDYMTPSGKRMLRERPVKPTAKAKELQMQSTSRGRGNRGRGNRGKH